MESTLAERHTTLARLTDEIGKLERQARIEARRLAAQAAASPHAFADLVGAGGPAPGIPNGFASTGVSFEGTASWYGPGFEGNPTASGQIFDSSLFTAASRDLPLGTWLHVTYGGRGVIVLVNDRGPYIDDRVLDLSRAAAEALGITGLGWVRAEIVVKT
jgi:rare lipoprotein A (peptidoglycan hydrolase)